jgi:uncharacterized protein
MSVVKSLRILPIAALGLSGTSLAPAASFDCGKAVTAVEKAICASPEVSDLDEYLGRYFQAARAEVGSAGACLVRNQRDWLRGTRNKCADAACLKPVYLARLAELDALQPGASALKNVELPRVKTLVWIVPAAEDTVAAPPPAKPEPFVLTGKLVDDVAGGDGYVLQDAQGVKHVLLSLMFINKSSGVRLETLALDKSATFEARGQRETSSDGTAHFAPGACTFLYRLPESGLPTPSSRTGS